MNKKVKDGDTENFATFSKEGIDSIKTLQDLLIITEGLENKYISPKTDRECFHGLTYPKCISWIQGEIDGINKSLDRVTKILFGLAIVNLNAYEEFKGDVLLENRKNRDTDEKINIPYSAQVKLVKNGVSATWSKVGLKAGKNPQMIFQHYDYLPQLKNHSYAKSSFNSASPVIRKAIMENFEPEFLLLREITETIGRIRLALVTIQRRIDERKEECDS